MWMMKRRSSSSSQFLKSHLEVSLKCLSDEEEKAFAEDAARCLRGCIWPPRSYSCSFCSREFRSAQALGGHMNVHRRDRAKLKQSPNDHEHHSRVSSSPIAEEDEEEQKIKQAFGYSDSTAKRPLSDVISGSDDDDDHVETKLSVGLTSVLFQNRHACDNKRPKVAAVSSTLQILGLKPATSSMEGLDLELRL